MPGPRTAATGERKSGSGRTQGRKEARTQREIAEIPILLCAFAPWRLCVLGLVLLGGENHSELVSARGGGGRPLALEVLDHVVNEGKRPSHAVALERPGGVVPSVSSGRDRGDVVRDTDVGTSILDAGRELDEPPGMAGEISFRALHQSREHRAQEESVGADSIGGRGLGGLESNRMPLEAFRGPGAHAVEDGSELNEIDRRRLARHETENGIAVALGADELGAHATKLRLPALPTFPAVVAVVLGAEPPDGREQSVERGSHFQNRLLPQ